MMSPAAALRVGFDARALHSPAAGVRRYITQLIDAIQNSLKLPDSAMELSRSSLAEVGNLSSASVLHVLEKTVTADPPPPGSAGLMIGLGPGISVELMLLQW